MQMQVVMLQNQASQGATLDAASGGVARILEVQGIQGPKIDNTLRTVVSIHTLLETIHKNLGNISATTDGSPQQLHAAAVNAVTQPLQQDGAEPREEEFKIMYKVLLLHSPHHRCCCERHIQWQTAASIASQGTQDGG